MATIASASDGRASRTVMDDGWDMQLSPQIKGLATVAGRAHRRRVEPRARGGAGGESLEQDHRAPADLGPEILGHVAVLRHHVRANPIMEPAAGGGDLEPVGPGIVRVGL